jgi:hypothetical protein
MTGLAERFRHAAAGLYAMMAFKPGWRSRFDVSFDGMIASFGGALIALPAFALIVLGSNHFIAAHPGIVDPSVHVGLWGAAGQYARIWLLFPPVALLVCLVLGLKTGLAAWITVHNWAVTVLLWIQALIWMLHASGIIGLEVLSFLLALYQVLRLAVHWRVAMGALVFTGELFRLNIEIQQALDEVGLNFFQSV